MEFSNYKYKMLSSMMDPTGSGGKVSKQTVQLNPKLIAELASRHPSMLPIPDYVLNDEVRAYEPTYEALFM